MSDKSNIQWTEATWNPVAGCTRVSAGCDNCYAVQMSHRLELMGQAKYAGLTVLNNRGDRHFNGTEREFVWTDGMDVTWRRPGSDRHEWCMFGTWLAWVRGATLVRTFTTGLESWAEGHPGSPDATRPGGVSRPLRSDARATEVRDG